jgi:hypothetical protein
MVACKGHYFGPLRIGTWSSATGGMQGAAVGSAPTTTSLVGSAADAQGHGSCMDARQALPWGMWWGRSVRSCALMLVLVLGVAGVQWDTLVLVGHMAP